MCLYVWCQTVALKGWYLYFLLDTRCSWKHNSMWKITQTPIFIQQRWQRVLFGWEWEFQYGGNFSVSWDPNFPNEEINFELTSKFFLSHGTMPPRKFPVDLKAWFCRIKWLTSNIRHNRNNSHLTWEWTYANNRNNSHLTWEWTYANNRNNSHLTWEWTYANNRNNSHLTWEWTYANNRNNSHLTWEWTYANSNSCALTAWAVFPRSVGVMIRRNLIGLPQLHIVNDSDIWMRTAREWREASHTVRARFDTRLSPVGDRLFCSMNSKTISQIMLSIGPNL